MLYVQYTRPELLSRPTPVCYEVFLLWFWYIPVLHFLSFYLSFPFVASWAVMSYPEIQSLVLDASFDDLLPLALKVMPDSWSKSKGLTVMNYINCLQQVTLYNNWNIFALRTAGAAYS